MLLSEAFLAALGLLSVLFISLVMEFFELLVMSPPPYPLSINTMFKFLAAAIMSFEKNYYLWFWGRLFLGLWDAMLC